MEYLSDRLKEPDDFYEVLAWEKLSTRSQNTLQRAIERSDVWRISELKGFSFDLLSKISIEDLNDARFIGPSRAEELISELVALFENLGSAKDLDSAANAISQIISVSSLQILAKLSVDEDLDKYLERIGSADLLSPQERHALLQELMPSKNPFKRMMFGKRDQEVALGHLIDANLRLSFALAKRVCPDRDIRARTVAGNLGLLAGITSFSDKPNIDFESYVMKHVREFIQDLIGSLNLSYDDIVELMLDANESELDSVDIEEDAETEAAFGSCTTFSELYEELDRELLKLPKIDERAITMFKHRHSAFVEPILTLDEIGKKWGVTRERVRQIVDPLMKVNIQTSSEIHILKNAVEIMEESEDEEEFKSLILERGYLTERNMTWEQLLGLTTIFATKDLKKRVLQKHQQWQEINSADRKVRSDIRKFRTQFGLIDLEVVRNRFKIDDNKIIKIISDIYPRSIRSGSLVLARLANRTTMFEFSIAKQLKVHSPLRTHDLLIGLHRSGKQRDVALIGSKDDLSNLIELLAGTPPTYETAARGLLEEIEFRTVEEWLIDIFSEANLGILHSNDVINLALRAKEINVNSVNVYLSNSPIIRAHGRALYSLVGTEVAQNELDAYIQIIRGTSEASQVAYEMTDASRGILSVKPNINVITNGIVYPPTGYKRIFEGFEFESSCVCGQLETIQAVKFAPSGFWTGFTAMIRHGFSHHQMSKGSTFRFEFDFDKSVVRLLVN